MPVRFDAIDRFEHVIHEESDLGAEQVEAIDWLVAHPFSMLLAEVGMGKAIMSLSTVMRLLVELPIDSFDKVLVVAPIRVCYQTWPVEIREWRHTAALNCVILRISDHDLRVRKASQEAYDDARDESRSTGAATRARGLAATREKARLRRLLLDRTETIHIIDRGSVEWLVERCAETGHWPYQVVLFDEASCLGAHTNGVFKAIKRVRPHITRMHLLTATPASQTYIKFFALTYLLDKGERFGRFITHYREKYFTYNDHSRTYRLRKGAAEEIERKISDIAYVMRKDRREDEKPLIVRRNVILAEDTMALYRSFELESVIDLPSGVTIAADTAAALGSKLLQAAAGAIYDADKAWHWLHDAKIETLRDLYDELQETGEQLLVSYWFKPSLERLRKAFPKATVMDREGAAVTAWNAKQCGMLLVHPQSAGHGLNMQFGGHHLALYDIFHALELFTQIVGRLDRRQQANRVIVHMLTALGTHDEVVARNLANLGGREQAMYSRLAALQKLAKGDALTVGEARLVEGAMHNASLLAEFAVQ